MYKGIFNLEFVNYAYYYMISEGDYNKLVEMFSGDQEYEDFLNWLGQFEKVDGKYYMLFDDSGDDWLEAFGEAGLELGTMQYIRSSDTHGPK